MASQKENVKFNSSKSLEIRRGLNLNGTMPKGIPLQGKRKPGAGRKSGPETTTISFRVPIEQENRIKVMVKNYLKNITPISDSNCIKERFDEIESKFGENGPSETIVFANWEQGPITAIIENQKPLN
jgi:hypothetical protein